MTIFESQIFIALFIALGNGFLAFFLGTALYQKN
jgi:photosystem I reaction center subunit XII